MPSNHTEHYNLSQWERTDKILMDDFNADNAKIDAALAALTLRLPVELKRVKLTGTAKKITFDLSGIDVTQYVRLRIHTDWLNVSDGRIGLRANDIQAGYDVRKPGAATQNNAKYVEFGLYGVTLGYADIRPMGDWTLFYVEDISIPHNSSSFFGDWMWVSQKNLAYRDINKLELICMGTDDLFQPGSEVILYGFKC